LDQERREAAMVVATQLGNNARTYPARDKGVHQGLIIGKTPHYVIQRTAPQVAILHTRACIEGEVRRGASLKLNYREGRATVNPLIEEKRELGLTR
jgi:hypothetical protein